MRIDFKCLLTGVAGMILAASGAAFAETRGVTDTEIRVGSHTALT